MDTIIELIKKCRKMLSKPALYAYVCNISNLPRIVHLPVKLTQKCKDKIRVPRHV